MRRKRCSRENSRTRPGSDAPVVEVKSVTFVPTSPVLLSQICASLFFFFLVSPETYFTENMLTFYTTLTLISANCYSQSPKLGKRFLRNRCQRTRGLHTKHFFPFLSCSERACAKPERGSNKLHVTCSRKKIMGWWSNKRPNAEQRLLVSFQNFNDDVTRLLGRKLVLLNRNMKWQQRAEVEANRGTVGEKDGQEEECLLQTPVYFQLRAAERERNGHCVCACAGDPFIPTLGLPSSPLSRFMKLGQLSLPVRISSSDSQFTTPGIRGRKK